ncbi:MAG: hypothetical protein ABI878_05690 [Acidobacteriota bacterium]
MQIPYDSLDDFASSIAVAQEPEDSPPFRRLCLSGEIEVLKPLVSAEAFAALAPKAIEDISAPSHAGGNWFSGHARTLALAVSFAIVVLLAAALFIGTYRPNTETSNTGNDVAVDQQSEQNPAQTENLAGPATGLSDPLPETGTPSVSNAPRAIRSAIRPQPVVSRVIRAFYRSKPSMPKPQIIDSGFVPTTLVIYIEKGAIKTRIEPQLSSSYKKPTPLQN